MSSDPATSPQPALVSPPWRLAGSGWIFLFTFEKGYLRERALVPPEFGEGFEARLGVLMLVDYRRSDAGPYRELLFLVGRNLRWRHHLFAITRIYVSTELSAVNGRHHWGIPKQTAEFQVVRKGDAERAIVLRDGLAEVDLSAATVPDSLVLPGVSSLLPRSWRTLCQPWNGHFYYTRLSGWGMVRRARLLDFRTLPHLFPDVTEGEFVDGFRVEDFRLRFPPAQISPRALPA